MKLGHKACGVHDKRHHRDAISLSYWSDRGRASMGHDSGENGNVNIHQMSLLFSSKEEEEVGGETEEEREPTQLFE